LKQDQRSDKKPLNKKCSEKLTVRERLTPVQWKFTSLIFHCTGPLFCKSVAPFPQKDGFPIACAEQSRQGNGKFIMTRAQ
jgi:hypothetical protein